MNANERAQYWWRIEENFLSLVNKFDKVMLK